MAADASPQNSGARHRLGLIEKAASWLASAAIIGILVMVSFELISRNFLHVSFPFVLEVSGYLLVAAFFLSIGACFAADAFHRVEVIRDRLPPAGQLILDIAFNIVALLGCLILLWYLGRFEWLTWARNEVSPAVRTPLYIPRAVMPIGMAILCYVIARETLRKLRAVASQSALNRATPWR
jgi:TRAP-type C4-dicarboxylate transport system permease small subunit